MKYASIAVVLAGLSILTGCETPSPGILSLNPIVTDKDTDIDASLVGTWEPAADGDVLCIIRLNGSHKYDIVLLGSDAPVAFTASLVRVGDVSLLDVTPTDKGDFRIPGHAMVRIWPTGMGLRWAYLDSEWLQQAAAVLSTQSPDGKMLLLSPTNVVRNWLAGVAGDGRAYGKVITWRRVQ